LRCYDTQQNDTQQNGTQQNDSQQNDTQQNDTQQKDTQRNDTQQNDTQQNDTQHNDIEHNTKLNATLHKMTMLLCCVSSMLNVIYVQCCKLVIYAEYHYAGCRCAERRDTIFKTLNKDCILGVSSIKLD
jgi:hypothetical protein